MPKRQHELEHAPVFGHDVPLEPLPALPGVRAVTMRQIEAAWERGCFIDEVGILWVSEKELHTILRTLRVNARDFMLDVDDSDKRTLDGIEYVRSYLVVGEISRRSEHTGEVKRSRLLELSYKLASAFLYSDIARVRRAEAAQQRAIIVKKLKRERIKRLGGPVDELAGVSSTANSLEFCHIIAQSERPDLADCVWNGVLVRKALHAQITRAGVLNAEALLDFCTERSLRTDWYESFDAEYKRGLARY